MPEHWYDNNVYFGYLGRYQLNLSVEDVKTKQWQTFLGFTLLLTCASIWRSYEHSAHKRTMLMLNAFRSDTGLLLSIYENVQWEDYFKNSSENAAAEHLTSHRYCGDWSDSVVIGTIIRCDSFRYRNRCEISFPITHIHIRMEYYIRSKLFLCIFFLSFSSSSLARDVPTTTHKMANTGCCVRVCLRLMSIHDAKFILRTITDRKDEWKNVVDMPPHMVTSWSRWMQP